MKLKKNKEPEASFINTRNAIRASKSTHCNANHIITKLHWHECIEMLRITEGDAVFYIEKQHINAKKDDLIIINSTQLHSGVAGPQGVTFDVIMFEATSFLNHTKLSKKYIEEIAENKILFSNLVNNPDIVKVFDELQTYCNNQENSISFSFASVGKIYEILGLMYEFSEVAKSFSFEYSKTVQPIIKYIEEHYSENLSTENLCKRFGYNKSYFCRLFKQNTGYSVLNYIKIFRLEKSKEFFNLNYKIEEIVSLCGFNNSSYFAREFHKYYGCTPSKFMSMKKNK